MNNLSTALAFVVGTILLSHSIAQTNAVPSYSPPPPPLDEGMTWEDWTNSVEYKCTIIRAGETNTYVKSTNDNTDTPPTPDIDNVGDEVYGYMRRKDYEPVEFVVSLQETLTGETNMIISIKTDKPTGFLKTKVER